MTVYVVESEIRWEFNTDYDMEAFAKYEDAFEYANFLFNNEKREYYDFFKDEQMIESVCTDDAYQVWENKNYIENHSCIKICELNVNGI